MKEKAKNIKAVAGQKFTRGHELGKKYIYGTGERARKNRSVLRRAITGAAGGIAGATIGIAAGVATGDLGNAVKFGAAGAAAGYVGGKNLGDNLSAKGKALTDKIEKKTMGTEAYNNKKFDEQFFKSDDYKVFAEKHGKGAKEIAQSYLDRGITDTKEMEKLMKSGINAVDYSAYKENGITDVAKMAELAKADIKPELYGALADEGITDVYKLKKIKKYAEGKNLNEKQLAERMRIVQNAPKEARDNKKQFNKYIDRLAKGKDWDEKTIKDIKEDLYNNLYDLV